MVSKPNPDEDRMIRHRLYNSYQLQMPMWDSPGDFATGKTTGGCYNCNGAFKLGSGTGPYAPGSYNAYSAPSEFFYVPTNFGGKRPNRRPKIDPVIQKQADLDWYELVKQLIPLGFQIGDIAKVFYQKYFNKYGGSVMNDMMNLDIKVFQQMAQQLGEHEYY
jgi:hypothetical protein